jgi:hypothetical protein
MVTALESRMPANLVWTRFPSGKQNKANWNVSSAGSIYLFRNYKN